MARTFLTPIDLAHNELQNAVIQNLAAAPGSPRQGQAYFDTTLKQFGVCVNPVGPVWAYLSPGGGTTVTAGDGTITIGGTASNPTVEVTAAGLTHTYISDFDTQVNSHTLNQLAAATASYAMGGNKITGLANGSVAGDAATFGQLPTVLPPTGAAGGDLTGTYPNPTLSGTANVLGIIRGNRLDQLAVPTASVSLGSQQITNLLDPTTPQAAATKAYVDAVSQGLSVKLAVVAGSVVPLPTNTYTAGVLTATANAVLPAVDGITLVLGERVLIQDEVAAANNGLYTVTSLGTAGTPWTLTRTLDMNVAAEVPGAFTFVESGTVNAGNGFVVANAGPFTLGATAINWTQFSGAGEITVGGGLTKTGNLIQIPATGLPIVNGGTGAITAPLARAGLGATGKYAAAIGDGASIAIAVAHGLGSRDVTVAVYDSVSYAEVMADIVHTDINTVTLGFTVAPGAGAFRVVVIG